MTEQRKWPDNWEWVDKEAAAKAAKIEEHLRKTEAAEKAAKIEEHLRKTEAAAKAAKIEDRMTITEAAAYVRSTLKPSERGPTNDLRDDESLLVATVSLADGTIGIDHSTDADWHAIYKAHLSLRDRLNERLLEKDACPFKPEPDEATLLWRELWDLSAGGQRDPSAAISRIREALAKRRDRRSPSRASRRGRCRALDI